MQRYSALPASPRPTADLVVSAYAANVDQYRDLFDPFERICGCRSLDLGNTAERLTKLDAQNNPNVDLAVMANYNALEALRKVLIDKIDASALPNYVSCLSSPSPLGDHWRSIFTFYSNSIVYHRQNSNDHVVARSVVASIKADCAASIGVSQAPLVLFNGGDRICGSRRVRDQDRQIAELKDNVTFYEIRSSHPVFQTDEIWSCAGRPSIGLPRLKMPLGWATLKEGQGAGMNAMVLVKGSKIATSRCG